MGEYSAKIDFQTIVACKEALEVYKAVLKAQSKSDYELKESAYDKICSKL